MAKSAGGKGKSRLLILAAAAVVLLGAGGFVTWKFVLAESPAPPPIAAKKTPATAPVASKTPATTTAPASSGPTPSDTLNQVAKAPTNAIQKTKDVINARRDKSQAAANEVIDAADLSNKAAVPATGTTKMKSSTGVQSVAPGLTATTALEAASDATPAFRSFVLNVKINGAAPTRAVINGKLTRVGEIVDSALGISFEGYDAEKKQLLFKDKSGASVLRRYP